MSAVRFDLDAPRAGPSPPVAPMRWWGWGSDAQAAQLSPTALALLRERLGLDGARVDAPVRITDVALSEPNLPPATLAALRTCVGEAHVHTDRLARISHAAGRSYPDLVRLRSGAVEHPPDAVVMPGSADEVAQLLSLASAEGIAVVPFGGGTSVVGGVEPLRGRFDVVISLDLRRLSSLREVDERSRLAHVEAGILGPALERALAERGFALGHYPQSFEYSTVGGWVAARSAGQASSGVGRIDDLLAGVDLATPTGTISLPALPPNAAGPDLRRLVLGSEGVLGAITSCTLRIRPRPQARHAEAWSLPSFEAGCAALRQLAQRRCLPDVARLSDEQETDVSLTLASNTTAVAWLRRYLRLRGQRRPCLVVTIYEGEGDEVAWRRARCRRALRAHGGVPLGAAPARSWERERFRGPYLRDELLDRGVLVETLETATTWSRLGELYGAVREALRTALATPSSEPVVMCHVSHLYETGASLYFTFLAPVAPDERLQRWAQAKRAACDAIVAHGGTISHHHGVGRDHRDWLVHEDGERSLDALRALKRELDPQGVMNPGKLLPDE
ncbi:FAD-binding oxidoreductase [Thermoleophilum album]|uniref:Alkyldihydroxyacetonephosphate synthase n=1 Tax=Thermoleophilum album TaxID=29539 RepID=A0A1H6FUQ4_THEAL|nr:FAD-binding oxidoreductase [Thermoleophilum album]SEH14531.1 alkyldihydroxyacetonephosphate synthase [Thermoleophilum album]